MSALQAQLIDQLADGSMCMDLVTFDRRGRAIGSRSEASAILCALDALEKRGLLTTATFVHPNGRRRCVAGRITPKGVDRLAELRKRARAAAGSDD